jgi:hypothetical protein
MMRILIVLLAVAGPAHAVVCKSVDAEGVVSYTDVPPEDCANPIRLPEYSRYAPRLIPGSSGESSTLPGGAAFTGYESMRIVEPQPGGAVRNDEGRVPVLITLQPGLQQGHRVTLTVDGRPLSSTFDDLSIELSGVQRGSHELQAAISDANGKRLIESSMVQFTMRQASRNGSSTPAEAAAGEAESQQDTMTPPIADIETLASPEAD